MSIYCDESGGIGRGVMTLAAVVIDTTAADVLLDQFKTATGLTGELKGSRINMDERAFVLDLFVKAGARAVVGIAISALKPGPGEDRGDHDRLTYSALLEDVIGSLLIEAQSCDGVIIDDGRYDAATLAPIRSEIAVLVGPCSQARLEISHRSAGLQIADVIANTFFNRAMVSPRQGELAAMVQPHLDRGRMKMRILASAALRPPSAFRAARISRSAHLSARPSCFPYAQARA